MKYKIGDKVTIKSYLREYDKFGSCVFVNSMSQYLGKSFIIECINKTNSYKLIDAGCWSYTDEMFEEKQSINSYNIF